MNIYMYIYLFLIKVKAQESIVSEESKRGDEVNYGINKNKMSVDERKHLVSEEWHISPLNDMEYDSRKSQIKKRSDKTNRHKQALRGGSLDEDHLVSDVLDQKKTKSKGPDEALDLTTPVEITVDNNLEKPTTIIPRSNDDKTEVKEVKATLKEVNVTNVLNSTKLETTDAITANPIADDKEKVDDKGRRASEYLFSSVEYYDEVPDFTEDVCPDDVIVITLELDELRNYDVECERILEWRSLE